MAARKGILHPHLVTSGILAGRRPMFVYTPPGYEGSRKRFPLLMLLHGMWGSQQDWPLKGELCRTLDRMIAKKQIPPMIVTIPSDGLHDNGTFYVNWHDGSGRFEDHMIDEVLAEVDANFRTSRARGKRAVAVWHRRSGSLTRHRRTIFHKLRGRAGLISVTEAGVSSRIAAAVSVVVAPLKGRLPLSISNSTTPRAKMSER